MRMWLSEPPSVFGLAGIGYRTWSDSSSYWNVTDEPGVSPLTTLIGMP